MRRNRTAMLSFSFGEVSPDYHGNMDSQPYQVALKRLENAYSRIQGGVSKMSGTEFISQAHATGTGFPVRLAPFVYDADHVYVLEFGDEYLRIWDKDGTVHQTITTNLYGAEHVHEIQIAGSDRFRFIAHVLYAPRRLDFNVGTGVFTLDVPTFTDTAEAVNFGDAGDHPGAVSFYEERVIFGGTINQPMTVWGSKTGVFLTFLPDSPITAASSWQHTMSHGAADNSRILWIDAYGVLIVATSTTEYSIRGTSDVGLTATSFLIRRESAYGSSPMQSKLIDDTLVFAQRYGKRLRSYSYRDVNSPYVGVEINMLAQHITGPGVRQMDNIQDPLGIVWFVRDDGVLIGVSKEPGADMWAWHRHTTDGKYESIAAIPGATRDELWAVVVRTIGGTELRYIERFSSMEKLPAQDGVFVHSAVIQGGETPLGLVGITFADPLTCEVSDASGLTAGDFIRLRRESGDEAIPGEGEYKIESIVGAVLTLGATNGAGAIDASSWGLTYTSGGVAVQIYDSVSGLSHLEGKTVAVLADGGRHAEQVVDTGAIDLNRWTEKAIVGLKYTAIAETLPGMFGMFQQSIRSGMRFLNTVGCLAGDSADDMREMLWKEPGDDYVGPAPLFTGDKRDFFPGFTKMDQGFAIGNDYPLPWNVLGVIMETTASPED